AGVARPGEERRPLPVRGRRAAVPAARGRRRPAGAVAGRGGRPEGGGGGAAGVRGGVAGPRRAGGAPAGVRGGDPSEAAATVQRPLVGRGGQTAPRPVGVPAG